MTGLTGTNVPNDEENVFWSRGGDSECGGDIQDCDFDNRGVGRSSVPISKSVHQGFIQKFLLFFFIYLFQIVYLNDILFDNNLKK